MPNVINATSTGSGGLVSTGDDSGILNIQTNETTAITVDASQNVGIGTASPVSKLNVNGGSVTLAETTTGAYNIDFQSRTASTNARIQYDQLTNTTGQLLFYTNGGSLTERMRIASDGAISAGSTTQTVGLGIWSNFGSRIVDFARYADDGAIVGFKRGGTVVGTISVTGSATAYNTSSDYRLKENIAPMTGALAKVALLKPVTYKWKADGSDGEGFIAHELAEVKPHCVSGEKDAVDAEGNPQYQGIDVSFLVATLTAAIQELKAINDTQAETINALTARIVALEGA